MCLFFITLLKSVSTDIKRNTARTVTGCWKRRRERWDSTEWGYRQKDTFVNTATNIRVRKRVENFVSEWQFDHKGRTAPWSNSSFWREYPNLIRNTSLSQSLHIAVTEAMTQRLQVWRYRYHCWRNSSYVSKIMSLQSWTCPVSLH